MSESCKSQIKLCPKCNSPQGRQVWNIEKENKLSEKSYECFDCGYKEE